jgi:predicted transcriptional regulator
LESEVYCIDDYEKNGKKYYYVSFKFNPVSSNYLTSYYNKYSSELTDEEKNLDKIRYKLYVGTSKNLSEDDFKYAIDSYGNQIDITHTYSRNTSNATIDYMENNHIFVHDSDEYVGKVFYWKVVAINGRGEVESNIHSFIVASETADTKPDLIDFINTLTNIADWIDWLI